MASDAKHHYCRICQCLLYNIERDQKWPDMDFDNMSVSTTQPNVQDDDDLDDLDGTSCLAASN